MQDSAFDSPTFTSPTFSPGFVLRNRRPQPSVVVDTRFKMPSSGIISTVNDLTRFALALIDTRLLPEAMFREMTSTRPAPGDERPMFTAGTVRAGRDAYGARGASRCAGVAVRIAKCCGIDFAHPLVTTEPHHRCELALLDVGRMP